MASSIFVEDGYTLDGRWPAAPDGRYLGGSFRYRCALGDVRDRYAAAPTSQRADVRAKILADHVESITPDDPDAGDAKQSFRPKADDWKKIRADIALYVLDAVLDYIGPERAEKN